MVVDVIGGVRSLQIGFNRHSRTGRRAPGELLANGVATASTQSKLPATKIHDVSDQRGRA
jgi:hypothetical protein